MPIPDYEPLAEALLSFIFLNGGAKFQVQANETYGPLADFFDLTGAERSEPRPDGYGGTHWQNRVQWTRQKLINEGLVMGRGRGQWGLTPGGVSRARHIASGHDRLRVT
jgi:restriction endonuclease Mrr